MPNPFGRAPLSFPSLHQPHPRAIGYCDRSRCRHRLYSRGTPSGCSAVLQGVLRGEPLTLSVLAARRSYNVCRHAILRTAPPSARSFVCGALGGRARLFHEGVAVEHSRTQGGARAVRLIGAAPWPFPRPVGTLEPLRWWHTQRNNEAGRAAAGSVSDEPGNDCESNDCARADD